MTKKLDSKKIHKKMIISFVLVLCASSVLADQTDFPPKELAPAQELDIKNLCYYEGKAYSEGAKLNGMSCLHKPTSEVFGKNRNVFQWQENKTTSQPLMH